VLLSRPFGLPPFLAGLPGESDFVHCEEDMTSCYFLNNTYLTYPQALKACKRLDGAYLVSWNDADEQLRLEGYFRVGVLWCWSLCDGGCMSALYVQ
jgi:hypothetical protein